METIEWQQIQVRDIVLAVRNLERCEKLGYKNNLSKSFLVLGIKTFTDSTGTIIAKEFSGRSFTRTSRNFYADSRYFDFYKIGRRKVFEEMLD